MFAYVKSKPPTPTVRKQQARERVAEKEAEQAMPNLHRFDSVSTVCSEDPDEPPPKRGRQESQEGEGDTTNIIIIFFE